MKSDWTFFSKEELSCTGSCPSCANSDTNMDNGFMFKMVELRRACGFPLRVTSAYRCPERNKEVSSTGLTGPHTTGKAIDIAVDREQAYIVLYHAFKLGFTGIGVKQKGSSRFIHLDWNLEGKPRPTVWSY